MLINVYDASGNPSSIFVDLKVKYTEVLGRRLQYSVRYQLDDTKGECFMK